MAVESVRRGRGFHKRRHRPNAARAELAKTVVRKNPEPPLVRRQGKGKGGDGKGAPVIAPLPPAADPSNSIVLNAGNPAQETPVPPLNPPSTVAPPAPPGLQAPPAPPPAPGVTTTSSSLTTSTALTSVQTTQTSVQTSVQTQTTVITTAQTSTQVSTQVTTIVSTQTAVSTSPVDSPQMTLTSFMITSPSNTQTSLSTASTTSTPFVASTPYQAAPSTTTSPAASRAPAIAPGTIAGIVVGILSFFIILGAVCLCSRRTRQRLLTPVTRRFTNNAMVSGGSRGVDSIGRPSGRGGGGDMHKSLMSEAESMAYTTPGQGDVKQPPMATVQASQGLSQNPVFMAPYARPNSWRTWRPSATFASGLEPLPDDMQLPPPPPHALTRYSAFPRNSGVSTGEDSSMPEYGWQAGASNADLGGLAPAPGAQQQQQQMLAPEYVAGPRELSSRAEYFQQQQQQGAVDGHGSYVTYSDTPLATPRTPIFVEGEQLAPLATSQEASPVDNNDDGSGESGDATRGDSWWGDGGDGVGSGAGRISGGGDDIDDNIDRRGDEQQQRQRQQQQPEGGIQEAQLGREAGAGGGHGGGAQGLEAEPPREQGQPAEQDQQVEPDERVFEEVAAVQGQHPGLRSSSSSSGIRKSPRVSFQALSSLEGEGDGGSDAGFSWSEAASEPYTAPRDGFGLSIIGTRRGTSRSGTGNGENPGRF
ncbi:hypothetical protein Daus18300_012395 [Diaporthe australafricana]|uniref:Uncharacterized protein n=1 Tax=Diaporthe australafricana TaxID=127596 RepID=A0ABR3W2Y9_9PEZI